MKKTNIKTKTYSVGFENFMIDIVKTDTEYNAWIYRDDIGIKTSLFGAMKNDTNLHEFKSWIKNNLLDDMYYYDKEIKDIEEMHERKIVV